MVIFLKNKYIYDLNKISTLNKKSQFYPIMQLKRKFKKGINIEHPRQFHYRYNDKI